MWQHSSIRIHPGLLYSSICTESVVHSRPSPFVHLYSSVSSELYSSTEAYHPHCSAVAKGALAMAMPSCTALVVAPSRPLLLNSSWSGFKPIRFSVLPSPLRRGRRIGNNWNPRIKRQGVVVTSFLPVDPWAPNTDQQSIASSLFAASLFPYLGFLYHLTKSKTAPKLTLFGFYFLLAFVGATIPAGIYAKVHYGTSLSNVDWLHGGAESLLTLTNLFIVFGLRNALQSPPKSEDDAPAQEEDERIPLSK